MGYDMQSAEPAVQAFLESLDAPQPHPRSAEDLVRARTGFVNFETADAPPAPPIEVRDRLVSAGSHKHVEIRILRPIGTAGPLPVILVFHGGGWVFGDRVSHDRLLRELANGAKAAVVYVEFSRAPEARSLWRQRRWQSRRGPRLALRASRPPLDRSAASLLSRYQG